MKTNTEQEYYIVKFKINTKILYALWYTDIIDGFITNNNKILSFSCFEELQKYANDQQILVIDDHTCDYNINAIVNYKNQFNCEEIYNFWNIVGDIANSLSIPFLGNKRTKIIDSVFNKLFYGCNVPALRGDGELYVPKWRWRERICLDQIISEGLQIIEKTLGN